MYRAWLVYALAVVGCGRVGFDARTSSVEDIDAPVDAIDAADASHACTTHIALPVPADGTISGSLGATSTTKGTCGGAAAEDVYQLDVAVDGSNVLFAVDGMMTPDNMLSAYIRRNCEDPASEIECDLTDGIGFKPQIQLFDVSPGTYYAFVDGLVATTYSGTYQVLLPEGAACNPATPRERCGASLACTGGVCTRSACNLVEDLTGPGPFVVNTNTADASAENLHAGTCGDASDGGLRAPEAVIGVTLANPVSNMIVSTDFVATTYDTLVYVRAGCQGAEIVCNDDGGSGLRARVQTGPLPADKYFVFIDGFGTNKGDAQVTITLVP